MQAIQTGQKKSDSASTLDNSQEIGTWQNPPLGSWGLRSTSRGVSDIVVDTQDREAWPSIGDQSTESTISDAGDIDNASVKSGSSVISSSSTSRQGDSSKGLPIMQQQQQPSQQGVPSQPPTPQAAQQPAGGQQSSSVPTSGATSAASSSVWGSSFPSSSSPATGAAVGIGDQLEKMDSTSTWGSSSGGASVGGVWGSSQPLRSNAGNNQANNMQGNANSQAGGRDSASNTITSLASSVASSSTSSSPGILGWSSAGQQLGGSASASSGAQGGSGSNPDSVSRGAAGEVITSSTSFSNSMWQGIGSGLDSTAWGSVGSSLSSSNSVMVSSISISTPTSMSSSLAPKSGDADQWGRSGGAASGWGSSHPDPPKPDNEGGWGSPDPLSNAGTEGWGSHTDTKTSGGSWGSQQPANAGWAQQDTKPPVNPSGWGPNQPPEKPVARCWGEPEAKANPNIAGWGAATDSRSSSSAWGGTPTEEKPQSSSWGAANPTAGGGQWSSSTNNNSGATAQGAWGGPGSQPRPIGSQPQQPAATWAQAACKGLPPRKPEMPPQVVQRDPRSAYIAEAISSSEGWGKTPIRQDTSWDLTESPKTPRKNLGAGAGPGMGGGLGGGGSSSSSSTSSGGDDNHWHHPNDGTAIWEATKEHSAPSSWGSDRAAPASSGNAMQSSSNQWQSDNDSGEWKGPGSSGVSDNNVWNGPPKENQWQGRRNSESSRSSSWGDNGAPDSNMWNNRDKPASWNNENKPDRWGNSGSDNHWGGGNKSNEWNSQENSWQSRNENRMEQWGSEAKSNEWNSGNPKKDDNVWDRNGTNVWGETGKTETGTWNQGRPTRSMSAGSWEDGNMDTQNWGGDGRDSRGSGGSGDVDNGTSYWGDPGTKVNKPWNSSQGPGGPMGGQPPMGGPMGGGPRPPDGGGNWNQPPNQPTKAVSSWGDGNQGKMDEWGPNRQGKPSNWGDNQMMGGQWQGAKPKTPGWGDAPDWGNNPSKAPYSGGMMMKHQMRSQLMQQLTDMGFKKEDAQNALISNNMNIDQAIAELLAGAARSRPDMMGDMEGPKGRQVRGIGGDDMPPGGPRLGDPGMGVPPNLQNAPFSNAQQQNPQAAMLANQLGKPGGPTSMQPQMAVQQRLLAQQQQIAAAKQVPQSAQLLAAQGQAAIRGQPPTTPSMQQQLIQQQIVQQLQMAVQAGLISPQLLNQQLTPNMLVMLQQLLQLQQVYQRLVQQQQVIQANRSLNPTQQRQQLEQVAVTIQKIRQQIVQQQQQISQAQQALSKQQAPAGGNPVVPPVNNTVPQTSVSTAAGSDPNKELLKDLPADMSSLQLNKEPRVPVSRLGQWKLPPPDRDSSSTELSVEDPHLNKAPGSKPLSSTHSSPNLQSSKSDPVNTSLPFSDSTWSTAAASEGSNSWPSTTTTITSTATGSTESDAKSSNSNESKDGESLDMQSDDGSDGKVPLDIVEFVPGKRWRGTMNKSAEDDPYLTPGDINRSLSVSTVKEDYITTTLGGKSGSSPTPSGLEGSHWSSLSNLASKGSSSSSNSWSSPPAMDPTASLANELWGAGVPNKTRPPPGLPSKGSSAWGQQPQSGGFHRSVSWAPGDRSSMAGQGSWGSAPTITPWLLLKKLSPQVDTNTLRTLCMQHGPLQAFHVIQSLGEGFVCYRTKEEAVKAQKALNTCSLGNTTLVAEFGSEVDVQRLVEQAAAAAATNSSASSLWPTSSSIAPKRSTSLSSGSGKLDLAAGSPISSVASQWNGGGMWSSGGPGNSSSLWAPALEDNPNPLLPGNLLGGQ